jgi:UDP-glucose 4-epimerase
MQNESTSTFQTVVIGGAGFLGSHVADELSRSGHRVTVFDLHHSDYLQPDQTMVVGDLGDQNVVRSVVAGKDYVYHYAGIAGIADARSNPVETVRSNILGTTHVLDACREFEVRKFMYASTIYVYSSHGSFYRASKQAAELLVESYHEAFGLSYSIMRYGSLYGRRANHFNSISNFIRQALTEGRILRKGDGAEIRDYIHVLDAARASVELLGHTGDSEYVMLTGSQSLRVRDVLTMIQEIIGEVSIEFLEGELDEEHYQITPYSFRPRIAKKYTLEYYHDLGQGVLDCIFEEYSDLVKSGKQPAVELPE